MNQKPPILFLGNEAFSTCPDYRQVPVLTKLVEIGWPISAVVIKQQPAKSRQLLEPVISSTAKQAGLKLVIANNATDLGEIVDYHQPRLGLVASFGLLLPKSILDRFTLGLVNVHPSLLPAYRGTTPIESAIADGQIKTGVSLIKTTHAMDAGPIYAQQAITIDEQISKLALTTKLGQLAAEMVPDTLTAIANGQATPKEQDEPRASYTKPLTVAKRPIDWDQPAVQIERQIRALAGWPGSTTNLGGHEVRIIKAMVVDDKNTTQPGQAEFDPTRKLIVINCHPGKIGISRLLVPGKKPLDAKDFSNGYRF